MAHRVLQSNAYSKDSATEQEIKDIKNEIKNNLSGYTLHSYECNDGMDEEGRYTIGIDADFDNPIEANEFNVWLRSIYNENTNKLGYARIRVHDCYHAADMNQPCMIGDVWNLYNN